MKKIYFVLLMNYKDTFINFETMQKSIEDTLNPPPDIASLIFKNLKNGLSERGIEPKDIRGMNEILKILETFMTKEHRNTIIA